MNIDVPEMAYNPRAHRSPKLSGSIIFSTPSYYYSKTFIELKMGTMSTTPLHYTQKGNITFFMGQII